MGKTVPITNAVDAVGSGIASWIGETGYITADRVAHILLGNVVHNIQTGKGR